MERFGQSALRGGGGREMQSMTRLAQVSPSTQLTIILKTNNKANRVGSMLQTVTHSDLTVTFLVPILMMRKLRHEELQNPAGGSILSHL